MEQISGWQLVVGQFVKVPTRFDECSAQNDGGFLLKWLYFCCISVQDCDERVTAMGWCGYLFKNVESCIKNDGFCTKTDESVLNMMNFVLQFINFNAHGQGGTVPQA